MPFGTLGRRWWRDHLYAVWDDCPWIQAQDLYYTLEQAQSGFITEEEIFAMQRQPAGKMEVRFYEEPIPHQVIGGFTSFTIPDYQAEEFTNLRHDFATSGI